MSQVSASTVCRQCQAYISRSQRSCRCEPMQSRGRCGKVSSKALHLLIVSWKEVAKLRTSPGIKLVSPAVASDIKWLKVCFLGATSMSGDFEEARRSLYRRG